MHRSNERWDWKLKTLVWKAIGAQEGRVSMYYHQHQHTHTPLLPCSSLRVNPSAKNTSSAA